MARNSGSAASTRVTARLNARLQPIDRGNFEDPLDEFLQKHRLGEVTGGGTQMANEPAGIEFCDIEIRLIDTSASTVTSVVGELDRLGAPKGSKLIFDRMPEAIARADEEDLDGVNLDEDDCLAFGVSEGLAIFLDGRGLSDEVYKTCDVNHVVGECNRLMAGIGVFRSHWQGSRETALYFYGASFERMSIAILPLITSYPLCRGARVEQIA